MNQQLTQFKHLVRINMHKANEIVQKNWFQILLLLLVAFIISQKDLSFQFNLNSSRQYPANDYAQQTGSVVASRFTSKEKEDELDLGEVGLQEGTSYEQSKNNKKNKKQASNLANTFSNIGFIMNPSYAKRHNIPPAIVAEKQRICESYIERYAAIAVQEMKKFGVPASITLAQGLLESNAGASRLARQNNNHFGIKCFSKSCRPGHCSNFTDDTHKDFFRKYKNAWESYRAHSLFLKRSRYKHLSNYGTKDYEKWAHGLKKAGYATDKRYAFKLIQLIKALKLYEYDQ